MWCSDGCHCNATLYRDVYLPFERSGGRPGNERAARVSPRRAAPVRPRGPAHCAVRPRGDRGFFLKERSIGSHRLTAPFPATHSMCCPPGHTGVDLGPHAIHQLAQGDGVHPPLQLLHSPVQVHVTLLQRCHALQQGGEHDSALRLLPIRDERVAAAVDHPRCTLVKVWRALSPDALLLL
jgi:hypothetical protein